MVLSAVLCSAGQTHGLTASPDVEDDEGAGHADDQLKVAPVAQQAGQTGQHHDSGAPSAFHGRPHSWPLAWNKHLHGSNVGGRLQALQNEGRVEKEKKEKG